MKNNPDKLYRRDFIKTTVAGTALAAAGMNSITGTMELYASPGPFTFPQPVYRTLGRTGLKVTIVSFGAMLTPEADVMKVAFDNGINYVDTARRYMGGKNEEIVGEALKGRRHKVHVATKTQPGSKTKTDIFKDVETSLKALGTDYVDVIQLHNLTGKERIYIPETREALLRLREQGKVRFFGVTTHTNEEEVINGLVDDKDKFFDTVLVKFNFRSDRKVHDAIARAAAANIGIIAMKTQAGGYSTREMGAMSPHQAALKWTLQNSNITMAIPGMRDMSHLREDIAVMGMRFGAADRLILDRYNTAIESYYCHMCDECSGTCPRDVEISTVNRSLMYAEGYRDRELAVSTYREIPDNASAMACIGCTDCTARCVNGLDIGAKMERARKLLA